MILPEIFRKYTKKVDLIVIPSFWGIGGNALQSKYSFSLEKKYYDALGITRSYENAYALLFVNSVGKYKSPFYSDRMMGGSYFVVPPLGLIYKTNNKNSSYLHIVKFDLNVLNQYREFYETDNDYFYYLKKTNTKKPGEDIPGSWKLNAKNVAILLLSTKRMAQAH